MFESVIEGDGIRIFEKYVMITFVSFAFIGKSKKVASTPNKLTSGLVGL